MALSNDLLSQFAKKVTDTKKPVAETTVYGTVVEYEGSNYVRLDGSDMLTPMSTTADAQPGERVTILIKNHKATVTGNVSSPSARIGSVEEINGKLKISIEELEATKATIENLDATYATIESLEAVDAKIENLDVENLDAKYAKIEDLEAVDAKIENLDVENLDAKYAKITDLDTVNADIHNLDATYAQITSAHAEKLAANEATINDLSADKADVADLNAANADITNLQADVADIDTLIFGSATGSTIQTSFANAVIAQLGKAQIKSAMIESVSAEQITAGDIITNNVRVLSEDGSLIISDETMQISDENRLRVQIGKDASNDYSINIWDADGKLMFSEGGITDRAIKEAIIRNDMVSETANISASKLNIDSLFTVINEDGSNTLKSSKILLDDGKQRLNVAFTAMTNKVIAGNTNLLRNSNFSKSTSHWVNVGMTVFGTAVEGNRTYLHIANEGVEGSVNNRVYHQTISESSDGYSHVKDETYTVSFDARSSVAGTRLRSTVGGANNANDYTLTTEWQRYTFTYTAEGSGSLTFWIREATADVDITDVKLEKGAYATAWTASPKDLEEVVASQGTQLSVVQGQIESKIWQTDITTAIDDIEIGGRNLIIDSKLDKASDKWYYISGLTMNFDNGYLALTKETTSNRYNYYQTSSKNSLLLNPEKGQAYTLSAEVMKLPGVDISSGSVIETQYRFSDSTVRFTATIPTDLPEGEWTKISSSGVYESNTPTSVGVYIILGAAAGGLACRNIKLEKGNKATDWSPAPEDAEDKITTLTTNYSTVKQDLTSISATVASHTSEIAKKAGSDEVTAVSDKVAAMELDLDGFKTTVSETYATQDSVSSLGSRVTQTEQDITSIVSRTEVVENKFDDYATVEFTEAQIKQESDNIKQTVSSTYATKDALALANTTIEQNKEAIKLRASKTELQNAVDELNISGRNLIVRRDELLNTYVEPGGAVIDSDLSYWSATMLNTIRVEPGATYTFSKDESSSIYYFRWAWYDENMNKLGRDAQSASEFQWTAPEGTAFIRVSYPYSDGSNPKLEKGSEATEFCVAIEDMEAKFDNYATVVQMEAAINVSKNGITQYVSETYTTKDEVATAIDDIEIGACNLIQNSDFSDGTRLWEIRGVTYELGIDETHGTYLQITSTEAPHSEHRIYPSTTDNFIHTGGTYSLSFYAKTDGEAVLQTNIAGGSDFSKNHTLTTAWQRYTWTYSASGGSITFWLTEANMTAYITKVQIERGDKVTDWSPYPDDMVTRVDLDRASSELSDDIEQADTRITANESMIQQLNNTIANLIVGKDGGSLMGQDENGTIFYNIGDIEGKLDNVIDLLNQVKNSSDSNSADMVSVWEELANLGVLKEYVGIGTHTYTEDGVSKVEPCVFLGEPDTDFKMVITNTKIMFMDGAYLPTYINTSGLVTENITINNELRQGNFKWKSRANGNYGLMWKGAGV